MSRHRVINGYVCPWNSSTCQLEVHQISYLLYSLLLNYSLLRCTCWTCIGFDTVTMRSLYFKGCFRLKRRNILAQVFTAWQTALDSLCQSDLLKNPALKKSVFSEAHWAEPQDPYSVSHFYIAGSHESHRWLSAPWHETQWALCNVRFPFAMSNKPLGAPCNDHSGNIFFK